VGLNADELEQYLREHGAELKLGRDTARSHLAVDDGGKNDARIELWESLAAWCPMTQLVFARTHWIVPSCHLRLHGCRSASAECSDIGRGMGWHT
jgi:hypothetical protein